MSEFEEDAAEGSPAPILAPVDERFETRHGIELAAEQVRRASLDSFSALAAALRGMVQHETSMLLSAPPGDILTHRGRLQLATELHERVVRFESRIEHARRRAKIVPRGTT